jgi:hypothetical protein
MPITLHPRDDGLVEIVLSGTLREQDHQATHRELAKVIDRVGRVRVLVRLDGFDGFAPGDAWEDFSLQQRNDEDTDALAVIGPAARKDAAMLFTGGELRPFPIRYFTEDALDEARDWLRRAGGQSDDRARD